MKISFWSPAKGSGAVTSNLACLGAMCSMMFQFKCLMLENHLQKNSIHHLVQSRTHHNMVFEDSFYHYRYAGMDSILDKLSMSHYQSNEELYKEIAKKIGEVSKDILEDYLYYIYNSNRMEVTHFEYGLREHILTILKASEIFADLTFIDTKSSQNLSTQLILQEADLIVVNLCQDQKILSHFFQHFQSILSKCIFLISKYKANADFNIDKISQTYKIDKSSVATVPYNMNYEEALKRGALIQFLINNYQSRAEYENKYFINEISKATRMLHNNIQEINKLQERF